MEFIKRNFAKIFILVILATVLTACGSSKPKDESDNNYVESKSEGNGQGVIKSDEELAALEEEGKQYEEASSTEPEDNPANVDMSAYEPESYGSGNFQDYWQGDDYFDLVGYLKDNGADIVYATNDQSYPVEDSTDINMYVASFYGEQWEITIMSDAGVTIGHAYCDTDGRLRKDPHYIVYCSSPGDLGGNITVDKNGTIFRSGVLTIMDSVVQYMNANRNSNDPLNGSGLNYASQPL